MHVEEEIKFLQSLLALVASPLISSREHTVSLLLFRDRIKHEKLKVRQVYNLGKGGLKKQLQLV